MQIRKLTEVRIIVALTWQSG